MNKRLASYELIGLLLLMTLTSLIFWLTDLDLLVSSWFYNSQTPTDPWPLKQNAWVRVLFDYAFAFIVGLGVLAFAVFTLSFSNSTIKRWRFKSLYLVLLIALGPGILVNLVVKDHWGRARPVHVREFGGTYDYTPPVMIAGTPDKSFVCGHCSVGYAFFGLYFLSQNHKALLFIITLGLGWGMGYTRMVAGGHFLSDVLWSGYLVFLMAYALYYGVYLRFCRHFQPDVN